MRPFLYAVLRIAPRMSVRQSVRSVPVLKLEKAVERPKVNGKVAHIMSNLRTCFEVETLRGRIMLK